VKLVFLEAFRNRSLASKEESRVKNLFLAEKFVMIKKNNLRKKEK